MELYKNVVLVLKYHTKKMYGEVEVKFQAFLTLVLDGGFFNVLFH
jgi:hypothetical protein